MGSVSCVSMFHMKVLHKGIGLHKLPSDLLSCHLSISLAKPRRSLHPSFLVVFSHLLVIRRFAQLFCTMAATCRTLNASSPIIPAFSDIGISRHRDIDIQRYTNR